MIGPMELAFPYAYTDDIPWTPLEEIDVDGGWFGGGWFVEQDLGGDWISDDQLGWFLAQGFHVTDAEPDPNNPPGQRFKIQRDALDNKTVLQELVNKYVAAYNEGKTANDVRYEDLIVLYNDLLVKTHSHLNRAAVSYDAFEVMYLANLDSITTEIDFYLNTTRADAGTAFDNAAAALNNITAKLPELQTGYDSYVSQIGSILSDQDAAVATFKGRTAAMLTQLDTDYAATVAAIAALETAHDADLTSHVSAFENKLDEIETTVTSTETTLLGLVDDMEAAFTAYNTAAAAIISTMSGELTDLDSSITGLMTTLDSQVATTKANYAAIVALLLSDYTAHATTTRALLTDLGSTELSRINEHYDNLLADNLQKLTDRGLYSSSLATQITVRVAREKSEAIAKLNDGLAREKVAHEHQLFGENAEVRKQQLASEDYQFKLSELAIQFRAQWAERLYGHALEVNKFYLAVRDSLRTAEGQFIQYEGQVRQQVANWKIATKKVVADAKDRVFGLRTAIANWKANNDYALAAELGKIRGQQTAIYGGDLASDMQNDQLATGARQTTINALNGYVAQYNAGMANYAGGITSSANFLANVRTAAAGQALQARLNKNKGLSEAHRQMQKLYAYQLDTRNNLAVGLFKFMENRSDTYPDVNKLGEIAMGLGDAGATQWIQP